MSVSSVTLDEILAAAHIRSASLVPETSGYLALAIADASARLPFQLEDSMAHLSTEGTVKVARGTDVVEPEESAAIVRDMLARLLSRSIGSMPGLNNAARPRQEAPEGIETVISDLEAALVPVNRAAARRALGRLAREVVKARDAGKLRRRAPREPRREPNREAPEPRRVDAERPRPQPRAAATVRAEMAEPLSVDVSFSESPPEDMPKELRRAPLRAPQGAMVTAAVDESDRHATPTDLGIATVVEEPNEPTAIDSVAVVLEQARNAVRAPEPLTVSAQRAEDIALLERETRREKRGSRRREVPGEALFEAAEKRSVDDLVATFSVTAYDSDASLKATRATLKRLAGLDLTPPPPPMAMRGLTPPPPRALADSDSFSVPLSKFASPRATLSSGHIALVVVGLVLAGLLGHYVPTWLDRTGSGDATVKAPASELSQRN